MRRGEARIANADGGYESELEARDELGSALGGPVVLGDICGRCTCSRCHMLDAIKTVMNEKCEMHSKIARN